MVDPLSSSHAASLRVVLSGQRGSLLSTEVAASTPADVTAACDKGFARRALDLNSTYTRGSGRCANLGNREHNRAYEGYTGASLFDLLSHCGTIREA